MPFYSSARTKSGAAREVHLARSIDGWNVVCSETDEVLHEENYLFEARSTASDHGYLIIHTES